MGGISFDNPDGRADLARAAFRPLLQNELRCRAFRLQLSPEEDLFVLPGLSGKGVTFRQRLEFFGLSLGVAVVGLLPGRILRSLANLLGAIVNALDRRGRQVAQANLDAAFGSALSAREKARITRASYQAFARTMLELCWSPNLTPEATGRLEFHQEAAGTGPEDPRRPIIYVCLHSSNFELLSLALGFSHGPGMIVTQQLKNPLLGRVFDRLRASTGHTIIPQERAMIRMYRHLKKGGYFCMLIDLNLDPSEASVVIDAFEGLKTCVTQMHAALALRTRAQIVPAECRVLPDGRYRLIYHKPLEYRADATAAEIAQICWDVLEPSIYAQPESWLWSYKHWRFKPSDDTSERYPFYANSAKRFDKLLARQCAAAA